MNDKAALLQRLQELSPERRAALETLYRQRQGAAATPQSARPPIAPLPRGGTFPLSFDQERIWFLHQLAPGQVSLVLQIRLRTEADVAAVETALRALMTRHEVLRTTYEMGEEGPVQRIHAVCAVPLPVVDLLGLPMAEAERRAVEALRDQRTRPFDLERGPVWRALLLRHATGADICLAVHHIATDGWSLNRLAGELEALLQASVAGGEARLPALPVQYADYSAWQRDWLRGPVLEQHLGYWRERLEGMPKALELPTDRPRPAYLGGAGASLCLVLPAGPTTRLRRLAETRKATLFMLLLALYKAFLFRYTGQTDIVVGTPVAGRDTPELEGLQGLFLNSLVLRTRFAAEDSFGRLLELTRETVLGAFEHRELPFEKLVEALQPQRDLSRNPLYQALFSKPIIGSLKAHAGDRSEEATGIRHMDEGQSEFDLALWVEEYEDTLGLVFHYSPSLFEAATVERMARHYARLAEAVGEDPERPLWALPMLGEAERRQLLRQWNDTSTAFPDLPVTRLFEAQVRATPDQVAIECEGARHDYRTLNASVNRLAHYLRTVGVGPEVRVGICLERGPAMLEAVLAVLKAGGGYVPLDPAFPVSRLEFMLRDSGATLLLTQDGPDVPALAPGDTRYIDLDAAAAEIAAQSAEDLADTPSGEDLAYMIYTSGSTGVPKGVQITHRNLANFLHAMRREPGLGRDDVLLAVTTLSFDIAGLELYLPLIVGARILLAGRRTAADGAALAELLTRGGATAMQATPATWRMLIDAGWPGSPRLKALCGGEALPGELAAQLLPRCAALWNLYGPTETTIWSTVARVSSGDTRTTIGRPIANTVIRILDAHAQPVPVGVPGELYIGGAGVARGYWQRPELNTERFLADPFGETDADRLYRTGDAARYLADGRIEYLGRLDTQVKLRGYRMELGEIESRLAAMPGIRQAVAAVREDRPGDQRLVAYVVREAETAPDSQQIRAFLGEGLPAYMVPSTCVFLDALPLTPNGKVDRKALPVVAWGERSDAGHVAPRSANEIALASVWSEVLGVERVGVHDNFFDIGGHSLLAMRAIASFRERTGQALDPRNFYQQSLGQLAASLDGEAGATPAAGAMLRLDPFLFGAPGRKLFGLLRHPLHPRGTGIVLCPPHAHEYIRCHRALRELAQRFARAGHHVLSLDYYGTGDSGGEYEDGELAGWLGDVDQAVEALHARAGVSHVVLAGLRVGATLALQAAARRRDIAAVVLWDPIVNGAELRPEVEQILAWQRLDASHLREVPMPDVLSFPMTPALADSLLKIDLQSAVARPLPPMLLLETGTDMQGGLARRARGAGTRIEHCVLDEARIWLREPYEAVVPHRTLNGILDWMEGLTA